ncbi:DUF645 family protein, partial [Vibrio cholerae]
MLNAPHGNFGFTKGCIIAVIWFSLSRTLNRSQLHSFWHWTCVC